MNGWTFSTEMEKEAEAVMYKLNAEPVMPEIGEKVREMAGELHEKLLNQELKWSLMLTPIRLLRDLQEMCENEIRRREIDLAELNKPKEEQ